MEPIKLKYNSNGAGFIEAFMPDGTKIPLVKSIEIVSVKGSLVSANISVIVDLSEFNSKESVSGEIKGFINGKELKFVINKG